MIEETGYVKELEAEGTDEAEARIENIDELLSKVVSYEESEEHPTLSGIQVLLRCAESLIQHNRCHLPDCQCLPPVLLLLKSHSVSDDSSEQLEEERRLAYVGITRAMKELTITCAKQRMIRGETQYNKVSRFVKEIPLELLEGKAPVVSRKESDSSIENTWNVKHGLQYHTAAFLLSYEQRQMHAPACSVRKAAVSSSCALVSHSSLTRWELKKCLLLLQN